MLVIALSVSVFNSAIVANVTNFFLSKLTLFINQAISDL